MATAGITSRQIYRNRCRPSTPGNKGTDTLPPPLFCDEINKQEFSKERWIDIPDEVQSVYRLWRPTTLFRAHKLEKALDTPAKNLLNRRQQSRRQSTNQILLSAGLL